MGGIFSQLFINKQRMNFETIMFFLFDMYKHVFMRKDIALKIVCLVKYLLSAS